MKLPALLSSLALRRHAQLAEPPAPSFTNGRTDGCISAFSALLQIPRVARARGVPVPTLHALVADNTTSRQVGPRRESRVNVRALNAALDALDARRTRARFTTNRRPA